MIVLNVEKQPWEERFWGIYYGDWLADGDSVGSVLPATVECLSTPGDVALTVANTTVIDTTHTKVEVHGGTDGEKYKITVRATTTLGEGIEAEIVVKVKDR